MRNRSDQRETNPLRLHTGESYLLLPLFQQFTGILTVEIAATTYKTHPIPCIDERQELIPTNPMVPLFRFWGYGASLPSLSAWVWKSVK